MREGGGLREWKGTREEQQHPLVGGEITQTGVRLGEDPYSVLELLGHLPGEVLPSEVAVRCGALVHGPLQLQLPGETEPAQL